MGQKRKALMTASVASMIDLFNMDNIHILQELGYEVHVASNFRFGSITSQARVDQFQSELEAAGIQTYHVPIPRSIGDIKNIILSYRKMKRICQRERYQIIHTQSPIGGVVARLAAKNLRKNGTFVIYMAHGFHFYNGAPKKNWLMFYPIEKYLSRYTDVLITINKEDYRRAKGLHAKRACYVSGIGIDIEEFRMPLANPEKLREEFGLKREDFVALSVGQLSLRKNQETIIRSIARLKDKNIKYIIAGLGEREEADKELIQKLNLGERVILAGYRSDIKDLLHMADCFVFPSLQEGLPVSLMEAMAAGTPVICSKIRGNTDLVIDRKEGWLVAPMDAAGYAEAIAEFKNRPEMARECAGRAYEKVKEFRKEKVHGQMEAIYRSCKSAEAFLRECP